LVNGRLALEYPDDPRMRVAHETIYRKIYTKGHHLDFLWEELPQARRKRRKRGQGKSRRGPSICNRVSIAERPLAVETREEFGHWEGDTIVGRAQDGFAVTVVERKSRLLSAVKTETKRANEVRRAVIDALQDYPVSWVKTITVDNGSEFADHEGIDEQVNGLIRRRLPKGTHFKDLTQNKLDEIVESINNRPRKCLAYRTPNEVFQEQRENYLRAIRI
jgi:IS30 family transposase